MRRGTRSSRRHLGYQPTCLDEHAQDSKCTSLASAHKNCKTKDQSFAVPKQQSTVFLRKEPPRLIAKQNKVIRISQARLVYHWLLAGRRRSQIRNARRGIAREYASRQFRDRTVVPFPPRPARASKELYHLNWCPNQQTYRESLHAERPVKCD
jgi:hypothetical protein